MRDYAPQLLAYRREMMRRRAVRNAAIARRQTAPVVRLEVVAKAVLYAIPAALILGLLAVAVSL